MPPTQVTNAPPLSPPRTWWPEAAILACFALFAVAVHYHRTGGSPEFLRLGTDAGNIASFAAALDQPTRFAGDELLANPDNFRFYWTIHVPLIRLLVRFTHHYGTAFIALYGLHVFLQLAGFYFLGRIACRDRFWAVLLALVTLPEVFIEALGDGWGIAPDPIPRFTFRAALGFLLGLALLWREQPRRWPWLMVACGLLVYVHPVSAPTIAFAVWLGLWPGCPAAWSWPRRLGWLLVLGGCFLAVAAPFSWNYLQAHQHGQTPDYQLLRRIFDFRFDPGHLHPQRAVKEVARTLIFSGLLPLTLWALALRWRCSWPEPGPLRVQALWLAGVVLVSVGLHGTAIATAKLQHSLPIELDLGRGLVYVFPLLWLIVISTLAHLEPQPPSPAGRWFILGGVVLAAAWFAGYGHGRLDQSLVANTYRLLRRGPAPARPEEDAIRAVSRLTPVGARILPLGVDALAIRYAALRPVRYCWKDGGALAYSNHTALQEWYGYARRLRRFEGAPWTSRKAAVVSDLARDLAANYLLVDCGPSATGLFAETAVKVWDNERYSLLRVRRPGDLGYQPPVPAEEPVWPAPLTAASGLRFYAQGGVVQDGVAWFTADSHYWHDGASFRKPAPFPFVVAFALGSFQKIRSYPFAETYDSSPFLVNARDGTPLILAHEYRLARTSARHRDTGNLRWTSPANQPDGLFFGYTSWHDPQRGTLVLMAGSNGLHALSADDGRECWWLERRSDGGVTPAVDQANGWAWWQHDGGLTQVRLADGTVLAETPVAHPATCVSGNTVLVNDRFGYFIATSWYGAPEWDSALRVYDRDLRLVWEHQWLPLSKKGTLTYAEGLLVAGSGNHWSQGYQGTAWKYLAAYDVRTGEVRWRCDLSRVDYASIMNVPYYQGCFYAETQDFPPRTSKLLRLNAATGALEETLDYGRALISCAPPALARGLLLSGDLWQDRIVVTRLADHGTTDWPGPFGDPQTNPFAAPPDPSAVRCPMTELHFPTEPSPPP